MQITDDMVTAALAAWNTTTGPDRDAMRAALEEALMSETDKLDKKYWAAAKADFQAKTLNVAGSPTWEELTDGQRNSLRWLAQRRAERKALKDATFHARYGTNADVRAAGEATLLAFDKETHEHVPFTLVGFNEAIAQRRIEEALKEHPIQAENILPGSIDVEWLSEPVSGHTFPYTPPTEESAR